MLLMSFLSSDIGSSDQEKCSIKYSFQRGMTIISGYGKPWGLTHIFACLFLASRLTSVVIVLYGLSKTHSTFLFGH